MFCSNCGKQLPDGAKFCNRCGAKVKQKPAPEPVFAPEPEPIPEPVFASEPEPIPEPVFAPEPEPMPEPVFVPCSAEPEETIRFMPEPEPEPVYTRPAPEPQPRVYGRREQPRPAQEQPAYTRPAPEPLFEEPSEPETSRPLSPWAYFGFSLLFLIPVVGVVLLIVFSFAAKNVNLKNFARSYWCGLVLLLAIGLIVLILALTGVLTGAFNAFAEWVRSDLPGLLSQIKLP